MSTFHINLQDAARKVDRNTPDLPSASGAGDKLKSQAGSAKADAKGAVNKVPSASQLGDKASSAAQSASGDAKSILDKAKNAISKNTPGAIGGAKVCQVEVKLVSMLLCLPTPLMSISTSSCSLLIGLGHVLSDLSAIRSVCLFQIKCLI